MTTTVDGYSGYAYSPAFISAPPKTPGRSTSYDKEPTQLYSSSVKNRASWLDLDLDHKSLRSSSSALNMPNPVLNTLDLSVKAAPGNVADQINDFLENMWPGAYKEFHEIKRNAFVAVQSKLNSVRYLYNPETNILIVMCPSEVHESAIMGIGRQFEEAIAAVIRGQNLGHLFEARYNRTTWYEDDDEGTYVADMTIAYEAKPLFHLEIMFTQRWSVLIAKVERILADEGVWGVLVFRIREEEWGPPKRDPMTEEDFMTNYQWDTAVRLIQADNPFAGLSCGSLAWTNKVQCTAYFFPSNWDRSDSNPTGYKLPAAGDIPPDFDDLNAELDAVWKNVVGDVGERSGIDLASTDFSIDWAAVRARLPDALRLTGFDRYLKWYGRNLHKEKAKKRQRDPGPKRFKPRKKSRA
jgi:hypothetical protein